MAGAAKRYAIAGVESRNGKARAANDVVRLDIVAAAAAEAAISVSHLYEPAPEAKLPFHRATAIYRLFKRCFGLGQVRRHLALASNPTFPVS